MSAGRYLRMQRFSNLSQRLMRRASLQAGKCVCRWSRLLNVRPCCGAGHLSAAAQPPGCGVCLSVRCGSSAPTILWPPSRMICEPRASSSATTTDSGSR